VIDNFLLTLFPESGPELYTFYGKDTCNIIEHNIVNKTEIIKSTIC